MAEEMAKIVRFHETGGPEVLKLETEARGMPGPSEVRLKVEAIGLNRAEAMFRAGAYLEAPDLPSKNGYEASGVIDAIGEGVTEFSIGDKVSTIPAFNMSAYGVYGESAIVPAAAVAKYPERLSAAEGTAIWMQYITAWGGLIDIGNLQSKDTVLITAASSSVGLAALQIAKHIGATTIATTRGSGKEEAIKAAGADHIIRTDHEDLAASVAQFTGDRGVNLIFDPVGGPLLEMLADAAAPGATIIEYGVLDERPTPFPLFPALAKGLTVRGYTLFEITMQADRTRLEKAVEFVTKMIETGTMTPVLDKRFPLDQIAEAHTYLESNQQTGKIIVEV
ncbi:MAG: NADPH:quinone reductase [Rhodomicrobium sp.]|nr:MAG: NADPH:quinone reductase [Rhodomicrobium sp.]